MQKILKGMRVVEGSAFVAAPSGGMTLAQLGADVIRFDQLGGGIDYKRWPLSDTGKSYTGILSIKVNVPLLLILEIKRVGN